jgi:signal peptidase II
LAANATPAIPMNMTRRYAIVLPVALLVLAADQASKVWVASSMPPWSGRPLVEGFFNLVHVHNKGAVFGILNDPNAVWPKYLFIAAAVLALGLIAYLIKTLEGKGPFLPVILGLILGGALGNLADRIRLGYVIDFLDLYVGENHWPAFNIADVAITLGAFGLLIYLYKQREKKPSR